MHRVELKAFTTSEEKLSFTGFLMHRVELKDRGKAIDVQKFNVPNAPCGVERFPNTTNSYEVS